MSAINEVHDLPQNLAYSVFPALSINFGPDVACTPHVDSGNLADGFCWLLAGGSFDSKKGGHLYLPELNLVIEFPAGSSIFFPSALLAHGNVPLEADCKQIRWSMTQYAAGGLFRWVEYGFHSWKSLEKYHPNIAASIKQERKELWRKRLELFSTPASLESDRERMRSLNDLRFKALQAEETRRRHEAWAQEREEQAFLQQTDAWKLSN